MAIRTLDDLRRHLQWSIELEHATLPPYLCALYSIEEGSNAEAAEVIHSVFMEEMLHLTLAANILNAVGGSPQIDAPGFMPTYPTFLPHSNEAFQVPLEKFSKESLEVFLKIERPAEHEGLPEDDDFETIGQFYEAIEEALERLSAELGEDVVFCGDPARQVTDELYYGGSGRIVEVSDLASARRALEEIVEQGEGLQHQEVWDGDRDMFHPEREEVAHYFRFNELAVGRRYRQGDTPQSGPTGEAVDVDWDAVHDMRPNPRSSDYPEGSEARALMEEFNRSYSGVLHLLHECFNGSPRLLAVATGEMYALKQQAIELMRLPSGDGRTTAGPSFEYIPPSERHRGIDRARRIAVIPNGPYLVYGNIPLVRKRKVVSEEDYSLAWERTAVLETEETYALCRCGHSGSKPFCDGTHARIDWDGTEAADTRLSVERRRIVAGSLTAETKDAPPRSGIVVKRDGYLCMHAAFCVGRTKRIPALMEGVADSDVRAQVIAMIERCPSGSYLYALEYEGLDVEPDYPVQIAVTEEETELAGPLWVTGEIPVARADGQPFETRNRMTLCRCGQSSEKPLCDGTHRKIGFRDESVRAAKEPAPALRPAQLSMRSGFEYTLTRSLETKPQSVIPCVWASSTARLDGAPTPASTGQPASAAFCTSSNESRPLTQITELRSGRRPWPKAQPTTLSKALWRPTSSRTQRSVPAASNRPVACRPPVSAKVGCAARSRSGSAPRSVQLTRSSDSTRGAWTATASSAPLPQTPHEDEV